MADFTNENAQMQGNGSSSGENGSGRLEVKNETFSASAALEQDVLHITAVGRLDMNSSPLLLDMFQEVKAQSEISAIEIDASKLEYVSSAGLRVFLIMYKSLEDSTRFKLLNTIPVVSEILEVTGFSFLF